MDAEAKPIETLIEDFSFLDDWEDRYRYVIELGKTLSPLADSERTEANKVRGCASQVWLVTERQPDGRLVFRGDSDAHIVRGLIAILFLLFSGRSADEIVSTDVRPVLARLGLEEHLTPQRSNGVKSMVQRIKADARAAAAA